MLATAIVDGDMIPGITVLGILHGTVHIGADLGAMAGGVFIQAGIPHGIITAGAGVVAITEEDTTAVTMVDTTVAAIGDITITAAGHHTELSTDAQQLPVRMDVMQAVTALRDHDLIYRQAEVCLRALLPIEVQQYAVANQGAVHH